MEQKKFILQKAKEFSLADFQWKILQTVEQLCMPKQNHSTTPHRNVKSSLSV